MIKTDSLLINDKRCDKANDNRNIQKYDTRTRSDRKMIRFDIQCQTPRSVEMQVASRIQINRVETHGTTVVKIGMSTTLEKSVVLKLGTGNGTEATWRGEDERVGHSKRRRDGEKGFCGFQMAVFNDKIGDSRVISGLWRDLRDARVMET